MDTSTTMLAGSHPAWSSAPCGQSLNKQTLKMSLTLKKRKQHSENFKSDDDKIMIITLIIMMMMIMKQLI